MMCCVFSTAQSTEARLDPITGDVVMPFAQSQLLANIVEDRKALQDRVKELEGKLTRAQKAVDSLERTHAQTIQNHNDFLMAERLRDQEIDQVAEEEISVWKGLSRGLSFSTNINSQVYNFVDGTASAPISLSARLALSGDRYSFAVIPFGAQLQFPSGNSQIIGGVKLSIGYKWF